MFVYAVYGLSDDTTFPYAIVFGVLGSLVVIVVVAGVILWGVTSTGSAAATSALAPGVLTSPTTVFTRPAAQTRFAPSQSNCASYSGYGSHDNQSYELRPSHYYSRIGVHSDLRQL